MASLQRLTRILCHKAMKNDALMRMAASHPAIRLLDCHSRRLTSSSAAPPPTATASKQEEAYITTGVHTARYPQQHMVEIHRRAAKNEDPIIERRRRIMVAKIVFGHLTLHALSICTGIFLIIWWAHQPI